MKVLLATDDGVSRTLLRRTLERSGIEVLCVSDGDSAVQAITAPNGPRIAILDWIMPGQDGLSVCRQVRACTSIPYAYLILLTSRESSADIVAGFDAGVDDYLTKPCNPGELKARLRVGERSLQLQDTLLHNSEHDPLTDLPNRAFFVKRLATAALRTFEQPGYRFSLLFVDIDRFKHINDSMGHLVGDELIKGVAHRLAHAVRRTADPQTVHDRRKSAATGDVIARIGGDEFMILLDDFADVEDGIRVAKRIGKILQEPFLIEGKKLYITASIGISSSSGVAIDSADILRGADTAMYKAKSQGKACYAVDEVRANSAAAGSLKMESDFRSALENNEFEVYYQPIVDLSDRRIVSFEALLRWNHPTLGLIPPSAFIPLAEESGLILPLGDWTLRQACRQIQQWNATLPVPERVSICINISPLQFREGLLVKTLGDVIAETGLDPRYIELEVTENLTMQDAAWASQVLRDLSELGLSISLDDFGTGYSSLSYLRRLPIRTLKIDRSFVAEIDVCREGSSVVETVVDLGHNLGMKVVAEGIETIAQLAFLETCHCDYGQGFLFSRPVPADAASDMLSNDRTPGPCRLQQVHPLISDSRGGKWVF